MTLCMYVRHYAFSFNLTHLKCQNHAYIINDFNTDCENVDKYSLETKYFIFFTYKQAASGGIRFCPFDQYAFRISGKLK